jgi:actin related protein 2/3 complex subunit 2
MIILEHANKIVEDTLKERFTSGKQTGIEIQCADYDGCMFHISNPAGDKTKISISLQTRCGPVLKKYGADNRLKAAYGAYFGAAEGGYDFTLTVNLTSLPAKDEEKEALARSLAFLKRHAFAAPFNHVFESMDGTPVTELLDIPFRGDERVFIKTQGKDRVQVFFTINFKDPDDIIIGKVFMQEFRKSVGGAPSMDFSQKDAPAELRGVAGLQADGYVSFILFDRHFQKSTRDKTIDMVIQFRNYLMYHIKCSKSHLHTRMRARVDSLLKILNRAKQDLPREKKTATGRTFKKAGAK